jgi:2-iminoacetate synthase
MIYNPQSYIVPDKRMQPFINTDEIWEYINHAKTEKQRIRDIIKKSLDKNRLTLEETASLVQVTDHGLIEEIKEGARELKQRIYGERIVLFAPLYIGNLCINNCA